MSSSKKILTCERWRDFLRQVFIRIYSLEVANFLRTFSNVGIFNPAVWSVLSPVVPLPFSLVQLSVSPPFFLVWISIQYCIRVQYRGGGEQSCESRRQTFSSISRPRFREIWKVSALSRSLTRESRRGRDRDLVFRDPTPPRTRARSLIANR